MEQIKKLAVAFLGRGEVKGFTFMQIHESDAAYVYKVTTDTGARHYEVFRKKVNTQFNCESYPKANSFGIWAWTYSNYDDAIGKFKTLKIKDNE